MAKVLSIETSTQNCSVSIQGDGCDFIVEKLAPQQHARLVLPMVDDVLQQAGLKPQDIDALAFGQGPGAFTGLRIAAGVIQGLALGWNKPVIGVSSLQALAYSGFMQTGNTEWTALMDARMQEVYIENVMFDSQGLLINHPEPSLVSIEQLKQQHLKSNAVGDVFETYPEFIELFTQTIHVYPSAKPIAKLALQRLEQAKYLAEEMPQPIYLRASVTN